jgi:RNA polymerase sigma factor (sigma-70 family)
MFDDTPFEEVIEQLRRGEESGANQIYHRFAQRLYALAQGRLNSVMRAKVGAEDVVQSVFRSFFSMVRAADEEGRFDVRNWDGLWAVLVLIAVRKCRRQWRRFRTATRDVQREQAMDAGDSSAAGWEAMDREPLPEEAASLGDLVQTLLGRLTPRDRTILEKRLQGHSIEEIVADTGRSERAVYRVLAEARQQLKALLECPGQIAGME